jgi:outer membrane protein assembly factor BamB
MSDEKRTSPEKPRSWFRIDFPKVAILLGILVYYLIASWPDKDVQGMTLNSAKSLTIFATGFALLLWALFFSGWDRIRLSLALMLLIGAAASTLKLRFNGDWFPMFEVKPWLLKAVGRTQDDRVEQHRQQQVNQSKRVFNPIVREVDFPEYRGVGRQGSILNQSIRTDWETNPPKIDWKQPCGEGYSGFVVVDQFLFTLEQRRDQEALICYEGNNGEEVWSHGWPAQFDESMGGPGPRSTPTYDSGEIFAIGATGHLVCVDAATGKEKWSVETLANNSNVTWAMCGTPLIVGQLVIVTPGVQSQSSSGRGVLAFDRQSGKEVWASGDAPAGYSSPQLSTLAGVQQIVHFDGNGISGMEIATGKVLWRFRWDTMSNINVAQPLIIGEDMISISSGYGVGAGAIRVQKANDSWKVTQVWRSKPTVMRSKFSNPVLKDDYIYGLNDGILECIEAKTGKRVWKDDRRSKKGEAYGHGQLLRVQDDLIILTEFGEVVLVEATPEAFRELGRLFVLEAKKTWNNFAIADGILYVRNDREMARLDLRIKP